MVDLDDQMESVRANINYLHDNILECQQNILQMEQAAGLVDIYIYIYIYIHIYIYR